jgi:hypothetical protein
MLGHHAFETVVATAAIVVIIDIVMIHTTQDTVGITTMIRAIPTAMTMARQMLIGWTLVWTM